MSQIISIAFDDARRADQMLDTLMEFEREGLLKLEDTSVVVRDADGKVSYRTTNELPGAGTGAAMGGALGLLLGTILLVPLVGAATGAAIGALGGAIVKDDLDQAYKKRMNDELRPNSSMLVLWVDDAARGDEITRRLSVQQLGGKVLRSNLSEEAERALQEALRGATSRV